MATSLTENIAAVARAELARREISRGDAAATLGISRQLMWSRLRGDTPFTIPELQKLAELCELPLKTFIPTDEQVAA